MALFDWRQAFMGPAAMSGYDPRAIALPLVQTALARQQQQPPNVIAPIPTPATAPIVGQTRPGVTPVDRSPSAFGNGAFDSNDRVNQQYGRGSADLTLGNIAKAAMLASSATGPMAPFSLAGSLIRNPAPFTGFVGPTPAGRAVIAAGGTLEQAQAADRAHATAMAGAHASNAAIASGQGMHVGHPGGGGGAFGNGNGGGSMNQGNAGARGGKEKI